MADATDRPRGSRALLLAGLASAAVYALLVAVGDAPAVAQALIGFPPLALVAMLALSAAGFVIRGLRWGALMRVAGSPVTPGTALYVHLAGQAMSVTPGRVGEVFKPWLARELAGMPMSRGVPLLFAERVADLIAVVLLASGGISAVGGAPWMVALALAAILAGAAVAASERFHRFAVGFVEHRRWFKEHRASAAAISDTLGRALAWRVLAWSVPASVVAWGLEGVGLALCVRALGIEAFGPTAAVSLYAVATLAGALSFLPGGIGLTEASIAGVLIASGAFPSAASAATLLIRVTTLWWGVALGWVVMGSRRLIRRAHA